MKRIILVVILFFNLIPIIKKNIITVIGPEMATAQFHGGELGEVIVNPPSNNPPIYYPPCWNCNPPPPDNPLSDPPPVIHHRIQTLFLKIHHLMWILIHVRNRIYRLVAMLLICLITQILVTK